MNISIGNGLASSIMKPKRSYFGFGSFLVVTLAGALFTGVGLLFLSDEITSRNWPTTSGTVSSVSSSLSSDGDRTYTPTLQYEVDGAMYTVTPQYSSSENVSVGDRKTIAYSPTDPSEGRLRLSGMGYILYLFPVIGVLLIIWAAVSFVRGLRRGSQINHIKQTGTALRGIVSDVQYARSTGSGSTRITVSAADPAGTVRTFTSDWISGNTLALSNYREQPIAVDVYLDVSDPEKYYVDISDVPTLGAADIAALLQKVSGGLPKPFTTSTVTPSAASASPTQQPLPSPQGQGVTPLAAPSAPEVPQPNPPQYPPTPPQNT